METADLDQAGPRSCCLEEENRETLLDYAGRSSALIRCQACRREFFTGRLFFDDMCIEPIEYEFWKEAGAERPNSGEELTEFIMSRKPYYARNILRGEVAFQRLD